MELLVAAIVIGIVALLLLSRDRREVDGTAVEQTATGLNPDRQFRRPPNEGDLL